MIKASTGLRDHLMTEGALRTALHEGVIRIYQGTPPLSADAALGGAMLLSTITGPDEAGLVFETTADNGSLLKNSEVWSGDNVATGTASFYRHVLLADDGSESTTALRIQGTCGTIASTADMRLSSTSLTEGATQTLDFYAVTLPTP